MILNRQIVMEREDSFAHPVYSPNVIEFVTVSREFCAWVENLKDQPSREFVNTALKILPLMYLKASMLPQLEMELDGFLEQTVTEEEYEILSLMIQAKMGGSDDYLEVFTADMQRSDLPLSSSVSENIADIYQDVKDFLMNYRTAVTEIMNDALVKLVNNFQTYWGQRLVNVLRALHQIYYSNAELGDNSALTFDVDKDSDEIKTDHWFISQRQKEWQDEHLPDFDDLE